MIGCGTFDGLEVMYANEPTWGYDEANRVQASAKHKLGQAHISVFGPPKPEIKSERIVNRYMRRFLPNSN